MKILFLNHNVAWSGGTFYRALPCATHLAARGHDVTLLSISPTRRVGNTRVEHDGVHLIETPDLFWGRGRSGWDPWDVIGRIATLGTHRDWDIVHSWDCRPVAILPALWARRRARDQPARLLTDWADWWGRGGTQSERGGRWMQAIWPLETYFEEHYRGRADGTTAISTALRERVIELGAPPARVHVLRQGCTLAERLDRAAARTRIGVTKDASLVLYVGRLIRSDAALLFASVARLLERRRSVQFVMVGNHGAAIPPALAVHARFRAPGVVSTASLADHVAACDLSLVPLADTLASRARWPSKINGFLSAGRATVVSRVGDLPALLERTGAALVTPPTADRLVAGVETLLDDAPQRTRIENAAFALSRGELSWSHLTSELDEFYRSL